MHISEKGKEFIKQHEGLSLKAYQCSAGKKTIGYGCVVSESYPNEITQGVADELLNEHLKICEDTLNKVDNVNNLEQHEYDMLISFIYNVGFLSTNIQNAIKNGNKEAITNYMLQYVFITRKGKKVKLQGLVNRRRNEFKVFVNGYL